MSLHDRFRKVREAQAAKATTPAPVVPDAQRLYTQLRHFIGLAKTCNSNDPRIRGHIRSGLELLRLQFTLMRVMTTVRVIRFHGGFVFHLTFPNIQVRTSKTNEYLRPKRSVLFLDIKRIPPEQALVLEKLCDDMRPLGQAPNADLRGRATQSISLPGVDESLSRWLSSHPAGPHGGLQELWEVYCQWKAPTLRVGVENSVDNSSSFPPEA